MIDSSLIWIVTDVDGTLMDHSYDLTPAKETIIWLKELKIPVILCTSKTAAEVKLIRQELNITDPYIVENGAAIYCDSNENNCFEIILGKSYNSLLDILNKLSMDINFKLKPLNELSDQEITNLTGLSGHSITLMKDRHWSMPFLNPPVHLEEKLNNLCGNYDVDIFKGNRMSHLLSKNSNKGKAIKELKNYSKNYDVKIIGLGDSPNDLPLLMNSDYKVIIPSIDGPNIKLLNQLKGTNVLVSDEPNGYGWKKEVIKLIKKIRS